MKQSLKLQQLGGEFPGQHERANKARRSLKPFLPCLWVGNIWCVGRTDHDHTPELRESCWKPGVILDRCRTKPVVSLLSIHATHLVLNISTLTTGRFHFQRPKRTVIIFHKVEMNSMDIFCCARRCTSMGLWWWGGTSRDVLACGHGPHSDFNHNPVGTSLLVNLTPWCTDRQLSCRFVFCLWP